MSINRFKSIDKAAAPKKKEAKKAKAPKASNEAKEAFVTIRIPQSYQRQAKAKAAVKGMKLYEYLASLIDNDK